MSKQNQTTDAAHDAIFHGKASQMLLGALSSAVVAVETQIIESAVLAQQHGMLTSDQARDRVSEIVGIRRLVAFLETAAQQGVRASKQEFDNG